MSPPVPCPVCNGRAAREFFRWEGAVVYQALLYASAEEARRCERRDIELAFCPRCGFVWNVAFDPAAVHYGSSYEASQMHSPAFRAYARGLAERLVQTYGLRDKDVLEVGCGDGAFLRLICELGRNRGVGFDPGCPGELGEAQAGVRFIADYYDDRHAGIQGDLVCSRHVLEHIADPRGFVAELKRLTHARNPVYFLEVPNVRWSLQEIAFWDVYYEHCSYFSRPSLVYLAEACGLSVAGIGEGFGQQYLCLEAFPGPEGMGTTADQQGDVALLGRDVEEFVAGVSQKAAQTRQQISSCVSRGQRAVVWGAGAKAVALLNFLRIEPDEIEAVVDINPSKQGKYVPGTGQAIVSPEWLAGYRPHTVLVPNPAYLEEISRTVRAMGLGAEVMGI